MNRKDIISILRTTIHEFGKLLLIIILLLTPMVGIAMLSVWLIEDVNVVLGTIVMGMLTIFYIMLWGNITEHYMKDYDQWIDHL